MSIKEDVIEMKKSVEEIKEQSFAMELLSDYKKQNKRLFVIIIVVLVMWLCTIGYLVYILNDMGVSETIDTIEIEDAETIDNSHIKIGDDVWEKLQ